MSSFALQLVYNKKGWSKYTLNNKLYVLKMWGYVLNDYMSQWCGQVNSHSELQTFVIDVASRRILHNDDLVVRRRKQSDKCHHLESLTVSWLTTTVTTMKKLWEKTNALW